MMNDSDIIRVYIPNRSPKNVRFNMKTTVKVCPILFFYALIEVIGQIPEL